MTHFELVSSMCEILATEGENFLAVDLDGSLFAEINGASFSCSSVEEFHEMCELFGEDDFAE